MKNNKIVDSSYPGPQKRKFGLNFILLSLNSFLTVFVLLSFFTILQENKNLIFQTPPTFLEFRLVDTKTSITILVSILGLILIRKHFLLGFMPRIIYESRKLNQSNIWFMKNEGALWSVKIKNVGLGAAVIQKYSFRILPESNYTMGYTELLEELKKTNLTFEKDFFISNVTKGYTIAAKEDLIVLEITLNTSYKLKCLDVRIEFVGYLGEKYVKEIYCIPRKGINNVVDFELAN